MKTVLKYDKQGNIEVDLSTISYSFFQNILSLSALSQSASVIIAGALEVRDHACSIVTANFYFLKFCL